MCSTTRFLIFSWFRNTLCSKVVGTVHGSENALTHFAVYLILCFSYILNAEKSDTHKLKKERSILAHNL